jgi:hypothetical protein
MYTAGIYPSPGIYHNTDENGNEAIMVQSTEHGSAPMNVTWSTEATRRWLDIFGGSRNPISDNAGSVSENFALKAIAVASGYLKEIEL